MKREKGGMREVRERERNEIEKRLKRSEEKGMHKPLSEISKVIGNGTINVVKSKRKEGYLVKRIDDD